MNDTKNEIQQLKASLKGEIFTPEDKGFTEAAAVWNKAITRQPQLVVMPENREDVAETLKFARKRNLPLSVKNGGHDWAGRSLGAGGLQINMRRMNRIEINAGEKTAVVQGGATNIEVIRAAELHRLMPVTGSYGEVGFAGLTLGGGYSPLTPSSGLAIDNVIGAEVILADGTVCRVDAESHPDLFWAVRGGGGNFGVVTSLTIRLHDAGPVLAGTVLFNGADAETVLRGLNELMANASDQLAVSSGMVVGPDGKPAVMLMPCWLGGSKPEGEKHIEALKQLAVPVNAEVSVTTYGDLIVTMSDGLRKMTGPCISTQTRWLPSLNRDAIRSIIDAFNRSISPFTVIGLHHFHGKPTTIPVTGTPFPMRERHYLIEIFSSWNSGDKNARQYEQWAVETSRDLEPSARPGGYANIVGPDDKEQIERVFGENAERLQKIKKTYDPNNVFKGIGSLNA